MIDKINKGIEQFQEFFGSNFPGCDQESVEILLMLAYGHMFDIFTPNQLIQIHGLDKNHVYDAINSWSIYHYEFFSYANKSLLNKVLNMSATVLSFLSIY